MAGDSHRAQEDRDGLKDASRRFPPLWRQVAAFAIAYGFAVLAISVLGSWPWFAAAFTGPLWMTLGAFYGSAMVRDV